MVKAKKSSENIVKVRDDHEPTTFRWDAQKNLFMPYNEQESEREDEPNGISKQDMRAKVEPWLTSLFQSEHLSLLIGSGLTTALEIAAVGKSINIMDKQDNFSVYADEIELAAKDSAEKSERSKANEANIEDYIRVVNELIRGLEIITTNDNRQKYKQKLDNLKKDLTVIFNNFTTNILAIERSIISSDEREDVFNKLVSFLMSFTSRTGTRDRLNIFTTNYDRLIEAGSDIAGLRLIDRFVGALSPVFRSSRIDVDMHYNPPGIRGEPRYLEGVARFTKLHGSLDWINTNHDIRRIGLPFGAKSIRPFLKNAGVDANSSLMIYPNSAKDRETAEYPYVELFRDFATALCRPNTTLVTYGYSFGDDHINRVIRDMLTIPSTHLVIISYDDNSGRIMRQFNKWGHHSQTSLMIGHEVANINDLIDYYLPKPAIDRASIRMAELLRQRFDIQHS